MCEAPKFKSELARMTSTRGVAARLDSVAGTELVLVDGVVHISAIAVQQATIIDALDGAYQFEVLHTCCKILVGLRATAKTCAACGHTRAHIRIVEDYAGSMLGHTMHVVSKVNRRQTYIYCTACGSQLDCAVYGRPIRGAEMKLLVKIGTHSLQEVTATNISSPPDKGDRLLIKRGQYAKEESCIVTEVSSNGFYFVELM